MTERREVYPDDRGRVSIGGLVGGRANVAEYYLGRRLENGTIILEPAVVMTRREIAALGKPAERAS